MQQNQNLKDQEVCQTAKGWQQEDCQREAVAPATKPQKGKKPFFTAKKIAIIAVFTALSYVISLFDFPIFPAAPFLKLDFGNVFLMLVGFLYGPIEAVIAVVIKEVIHIPVGTTGGVGELANILMTCAYVLIPSIAYRFKKGLKVVIPTLIVAVILQTACALVCNRFITFPLYMGDGAESTFNSLWQFIIYFNLIKGVAISVVCCLLYKTLSRLIKKIQ